MHMRMAIDDYSLIRSLSSGDDDAPFMLPAAEAAQYAATTTPGSLRTAEEIVAWCVRTARWAERATYQASVGSVASALSRPETITGGSYSVSAASLHTLGVGAITTAVSTPLTAYADAAEREAAEASGALRPGRGLRVLWVEVFGSAPTAGLHLRAMIEGGTGASEATAARVLSGGRATIDEVRQVLAAG